MKQNTYVEFCHVLTNTQFIIKKLILTPNNFKVYLYLHSQVVHFNSIYRATTVKPSYLLAHVLKK